MATKLKDLPGYAEWDALRVKWEASVAAGDPPTKQDAHFRRFRDFHNDCMQKLGTPEAML